jgi:hypothetical protein
MARAALSQRMPTSSDTAKRDTRVFARASELLRDRRGTLPVWIRAPKSGPEHYTGFTRSNLYELDAKGKNSEHKHSGTWSSKRYPPVQLAKHSRFYRELRDRTENEHAMNSRAKKKPGATFPGATGQQNYGTRYNFLRSVQRPFFAVGWRIEQECARIETKVELDEWNRENQERSDHERD